jgi:hypothetical protein
MPVRGMFTVTPIVNRYTGKAIRLCITTVETAGNKSVRERSMRAPNRSNRSFTTAAVFGARVDSVSGSKAQDRSKKAWYEESNLHSEEPITEFICRVNYI